MIVGMIMKILGIVTSYYPDLNELKHNINSYINGLDALIIWENTPKEYSQIQTIKEYLNNEKITVWTTGKNEYIAKPFNIAIAWRVIMWDFISEEEINTSNIIY